MYTKIALLVTLLLLSSGSVFADAEDVRRARKSDAYNELPSAIASGIENYIGRVSWANVNLADASYKDTGNGKVTVTLSLTAKPDEAALKHFILSGSGRIISVEDGVLKLQFKYRNPSDREKFESRVSMLLLDINTILNLKFDKADFDSIDTSAEWTSRFYKKHKRLPSSDETKSLYYGEYTDKVLYPNTQRFIKAVRAGKSTKYQMDLELTCSKRLIWYKHCYLGENNFF